MGSLTAVFCQVLSNFHETTLCLCLKPLEWMVERAKREETQCRFKCTANDIAAERAQDLFVQPHNKPLDAINKAMIHGSIVMLDVVSPQAVSQMRLHVMKWLKHLEQSESIDMIVGENCWSFVLSAAEHPSVERVLKEVGQK